jgi:hypothetical protein
VRRLADDVVDAGNKQFESLLERAFLRESNKRNRI